jgi:hypothetical protein
VPLGDPGAVADLGDQILVGVEVVAVQRLQGLDEVEQVPFGLGVVAQVPDARADGGPVLLPHVGAVVLVARPGPGELRIVVAAVEEELPVDELKNRCPRLCRGSGTAGG